LLLKDWGQKVKYRLKSSITVGIAFLLCWFFVNTFALAQNQDAQGLCYGWYSLDPDNESVAVGEITNNAHTQNWVFEGTAGSFVTLRLKVTSGNLDPFIYITDNATGSRIITSAATETDATPGIRIPNLQLPTDGSYTLTATRLGEQNGASTGSYSLSLEPGLENVYVAGELNANLDAMIYDGEVVNGQVPVAFQYDAWYFEGQRENQITAVVSSGDGSSLTGDLTLLLFSEGAWVEQRAISVDNGTELRLDNFQLPVGGLYVLRVRPTFTPFSNYQLTLGGSGGTRPELPGCRVVVAQCPEVSPLGVPAQSIFDQTPAFGNVTAASPAIAYQFAAFEGDVVSATMQRTGGDLDTFMGLADERGNVLARDSGFDPARSAINSFIVPADGCYFIYASREGVGDGDTEGTFIVTATGIPAGETTNVPQPPADINFGRDIAPGETATGTIADDRVQVAYRFRAETAGTYSAIATQSSGNLTPALVLYDADFNQLDAVTANFVGNASNPLTFQAEAEAYYFIVVQREGGAAGTSAGDFTLSVVPS
jgi:hypothetical protein